MWNDVLRLLMCVGIGAVVGLVLKIVVPSWCVRFSQWSLNPRREKLYIAAMLFFGLGAVMSFLDGSLVYGVLGVAMTLLELTALILVRRRKLKAPV